MSYLRKFQYKIVPQESYTIIRNCSGCGCKSSYQNSNNFRINANGNRVDVWLIYQCKKCQHTYNLTIYERIRPESILAKEYRSLMENDGELAMKYGTDKSLFLKNKAEFDGNSTSYLLLNSGTKKLVSDEAIQFQSGDIIEIENLCCIKVRMDKIVAEILHITRNKEKQLEKSGNIEILANYPGENTKIRLSGSFA